jgi:hypothetical protein
MRANRADSSAAFDELFRFLRRIRHGHNVQKTLTTGRSDFPLLRRILAGPFSGLRDRFGSSQMLATMRYWSYDLVSIGASRGNEILSLATF